MRKLLVMPRPKKPDADRHKPRRMAAIPEKMAEKLDELTLLHGSDFTEEVRIAVREYLQRQGLWPKNTGETH